MLEAVRKKVYELLNTDHSGHGMEHIDRVVKLSLRFAEIEHANQDVVSLIALLHDVDDYKLFGLEKALNLTNAKRILEECLIPKDIQAQVLEAIQTIGYSKRLKGIQPKTIEGMIVSDADMCDAIGVIGILRSYQYNISHGNLFFDRNIFPIENISAETYMTKKGGTVVTHIFEKLLKIQDLMLTEIGKAEAKKRHDIMIEFLYHFFEEENASDWIDYLDNYLKK